jgi:hypothetical protein
MYNILPLEVKYIYHGFSVKLLSNRARIISKSLISARLSDSNKTTTQI